MDYDMPGVQPGERATADFANALVDRANRANRTPHGVGHARATQDFVGLLPTKTEVPRFAHIIADTLPASYNLASTVNQPGGEPNAYLLAWDDLTQNLIDDPAQPCNVVPVYGLPLRAGDRIPVQWLGAISAFVPLRQPETVAVRFNSLSPQSGVYDGLLRSFDPNAQQWSDATPIWIQTVANQTPADTSNQYPAILLSYLSVAGSARPLVLAMPSGQSLSVGNVNPFGNIPPGPVSFSNVREILIDTGQLLVLGSDGFGNPLIRSKSLVFGDGRIVLFGNNNGINLTPPTGSIVYTTFPLGEVLYNQTALLTLQGDGSLKFSSVPGTVFFNGGGGDTAQFFSVSLNFSVSTNSPSTFSGAAAVQVNGGTASGDLPVLVNIPLRGTAGLGVFASVVVNAVFFDAPIIKLSVAFTASSDPGAVLSVSSSNAILQDTAWYKAV